MTITNIKETYEMINRLIPQKPEKPYNANSFNAVIAEQIYNTIEKSKVSKAS